MTPPPKGSTKSSSNDIGSNNHRNMKNKMKSKKQKNMGQPHHYTDIHAGCDWSLVGGLGIQRQTIFATFQTTILAHHSRPIFATI